MEIYGGDMPLPASGTMTLECGILHSLPFGLVVKFERIAMKKLG